MTTDTNVVWAHDTITALEDVIAICERHLSFWRERRKFAITPLELARIDAQIGGYERSIKDLRGSVASFKRAAQLE